MEPSSSTKATGDPPTADDQLEHPNSRGPTTTTQRQRLTSAPNPTHAQTNTGMATTRTTSVVRGGRRRAPKPNRQRCKEFRERRKAYAQELEEQVQTLHDEVDQLTRRRCMYSARLLQRRHHSFGSLEKTIREYFALFRHGVAAERDPDMPGRLQMQWDYLQRTIDPTTEYGEQKGPEGCLTQWTYFTAAHATFTGEVIRIEVTGTEDEPVLYCHTVYHCIYSRNTFRYLYPHTLHNEDLVQRMIGVHVACPVVGIFRFTEEGQITGEDANIEVAEALLMAGCSVADVSELMGSWVVSNRGQVPDALQTEDHVVLDELKSELDIPRSPESGEDDVKTQIAYLLDQNTFHSSESEADEDK